MKQPLAIDLFCGLFGWSSGLVAEGWRTIGFDLEDVCGQFGVPRPPNTPLVIQDVLTLDGAQFRNADLIVASPPCQEFSYMAMPWSRAKQIRRALRGEGEFPERYTGSRTIAELTRLFDARSRIQREACAAAGRHIPMIVENVRGAQPWVGRARWAFGSYFLWGDVLALMPATSCAGVKVPGMDWNGHPNGSKPVKADYKAVAFNSPKHSGRRTAPGNGTRFTSRDCGVEADEGRKGAGGGSGAAWFDKALDERRKSPDGTKRPGIGLSEVGFNVANAHIFGSMVEGVKIKRTAEDKRQHIGTKRKFASAMIAKIPETLSRHIARTYKPGDTMEAAAS